MHTRNFNFSKIFTKSLWEKSFDLLKRLSAKEANTMVMVKVKIAVVDEDELLILIVDRRDVSKEESPNFPSPIPPPPNLRKSGKMEIDEFILYLYLYLYLYFYLYLKGIFPGDFSEVLSKSKRQCQCQLLADEVCLSANTVEKFINNNGVTHEHEQAA
jgi:hypothetical protein